MSSLVPPSPWSEESFLFSGGEYFRRLIELARAARTSIRIESYIFDLDEKGRALLEELGRAAKRGVKVRLIVDAIGSPWWWRHDFDRAAARGVGVRVFGRPRDLIREAFRFIVRGRFFRAFQTLRKFQLRDHRKLAIFDSEIAIVGSANIGVLFDSWRETSVELRGPGVADLKQSFIRSWRFAAREKIPSAERRPRLPEVIDNFTRIERLQANGHFRERVRECRRLWMTTAYFHPRPKLVLALLALLRRNADVRILVPRRSDISWFPWLSRAAFAGLISSGARVFEFEGPMLHAKTTVFDKVALVGSRNMNYRSFMHDLELDVELSSATAMRTLEHQFEADCLRSVELTRAEIRGYQPMAFLISWGLLPFRRWL